MDFLQLLYAQYADYLAKDRHNNQSLTYMAFLEKLSVQLTRDEAGLMLINKSLLDLTEKNKRFDEEVDL